MTKKPSATEKTMYEALQNMNSIKHRVAGCSVKDCRPCAENKAATDSMALAIAAYELAYPRFEHDCNVCVFLGQFAGQDLYYCPGEPTVTARFGNKGEEYSSGLAFGRHHKMDLQHPLGEAYRRSRARGLGV